MRVRAIHVVLDVAGAARFYEALGLRSDVRSRSGHWIELAATGGELCLHDAAIAADRQGRRGIALNFVADEPLEAIDARLRVAGYPPEGAIVDQEWVGHCSCPALTAPSSKSRSPIASSTPERDRPAEQHGQPEERHPWPPLASATSSMTSMPRSPSTAPISVSRRNAHSAHVRNAHTRTSAPRRQRTQRRRGGGPASAACRSSNIRRQPNPAVQPTRRDASLSHP